MVWGLSLHVFFFFFFIVFLLKDERGQSVPLAQMLEFLSSSPYMCDCKPPRSPSGFPIPKSSKPEPAHRGLGVEVVSSDDEAWSSGHCLYQTPEKIRMISRIISSCFAKDFWILLRVLLLCLGWTSRMDRVDAVDSERMSQRHCKIMSFL